jgi:hypothetical protein
MIPRRCSPTHGRVELYPVAVRHICPGNRNHPPVDGRDRNLARREVQPRGQFGKTDGLGQGHVKPRAPLGIVPGQVAAQVQPHSMRPGQVRSPLDVQGPQPGTCGHACGWVPALETVQLVQRGLELRVRQRVPG